MKIRAVLPACLLLAACSGQPQIPSPASQQNFADGMPADLSGSWERDYSRGDDIEGVLNSMIRQMSRPVPEIGSRSGRPMPAPTASIGKVVALAQLAEVITRPDVLTISQDDHEIRIARDDDFTLLCEFYDGYARPTESDYGSEVCAWHGQQLVSHLILPDGLLVSHRFTLSTDGNSLQVSTTVASNSSRTPFTVNRVFVKFEPPQSDFNCVETLSMKRVCSTGEIFP